MTVEERIDLLEKKVNLYRWLTLASLLLFVFLGGSSAIALQEKEVRANKFTLEDSSGKKRAQILTDNGVAGLLLFDLNGKPRINLMVMKSGMPFLMLYDNEGKQKFNLSVGNNAPRLFLYDKDGNATAGLSVEKEGASLFLSDKETPRVGLMILDHQPALVMTNSNNKMRATIDQNGFTLFDNNGKKSWVAR